MDSQDLLIELPWLFRADPKPHRQPPSGFGWLGWCVEAYLLFGPC